MAGLDPATQQARFHAPHKDSSSLADAR